MVNAVFAFKASKLNNLCVFLVVQEPPQKGRATKNLFIDSYSCSPPRKSLVKGVRFIRVEGKPELKNNENIDST